MHRQLFVVLLLWPLSLLAASVDFFAQARAENKDIIVKIYNHPFNVALKRGILPTKTFEEFIAQDEYYLSVYNRLTKTLNASLTEKQKKYFHLVESVSVERTKSATRPMHLTRASKGYTSFLIKTSQQQPTAVLIAAMLPCQWLYEYVYKENNNLKPVKNNPYKHWLRVYQSKLYHLTTLGFIKLANQFYQHSEPKTRHLMFEAFRRGLNFEYQFWDDVYRRKT